MPDGVAWKIDAVACSDAWELMEEWLRIGGAVPSGGYVRKRLQGAAIECTDQSIERYKHELLAEVSITADRMRDELLQAIGNSAIHGGVMS